MFHPSPRLRVINHPSPRLRVTRPTPRRAGRDTPRPESTHANRVCAGPGGGGHWLLVTRNSLLVTDHPSPRLRVINHPGTTTHEKLHFRGARYRATPLLDEELVVFSLRAEFPSVWKLYSAGAFYFWVKKSPVWGIIFLMTKIMTKAIRCPSSRISNWPDEPESYPVYFYQFDAPTMPAPIRL